MYKDFYAFTGQLATKRILLLGCLCVHDQFVNMISSKLLVRLHQVYNFRAVGTKTTDHISRSKGYNETKHGKKWLVQKCIFPVKAYRAMVCRGRPSWRNILQYIWDNISTAHTDSNTHADILLTVRMHPW